MKALYLTVSSAKTKLVVYNDKSFLKHGSRPRLPRIRAGAGIGFRIPLTYLYRRPPDTGGCFLCSIITDIPFRSACPKKGRSAFMEKTVWSPPSEFE